MTEERYEIIKLLGKGRTGGVYEAEDSNLGRKVALRRFFAQSKETDIEEYKNDFEKVAHSLSALQHPNLLRVYDAGVDNDGAYIISQLLDGETLQAKIQAGAIPVWEVYDLAQQMLDALSTAHEEGFVHGAITPGSILMTPRARGGYLYVILDMGLSRLAPLIQGEDSILSIMADPAILAPELFDGGIGTESADLYMLGQILYMSLAGGHPFGGVSVREAEKMHHEGLPPLQQFVQDVPEDFRLWIEKLIQLNPVNRPASAVEALKSIPGVMRPSLHQSTAVLTATAHLSQGSTSYPQSPAGVNPALNPRLATGVTPVASNTVTTGAGLLRLPVAQKSSKKGLCMGLGALAVVGAIVITLIFNRSNTAKIESKITKNTPEKIVKIAPKSMTQPTPKEDSIISGAKTSSPARHTNEFKKGVIVHYNGAGFTNVKDWNFAGKEKQGLTNGKDAWRIADLNPRNYVGFAFPLSSSENAMYDLGWKLTYVVRPIEGSHRFGFNFDEKTNLGWEGGNISLLLSIKHNAEGKIELSALNAQSKVKQGKSTSVSYNGATGWHTIVVEQKPEASSGNYTVSIDGKHAFEDKFTRDIKYGNKNHFLSTLTSRITPGDWAIKEIKIETR